MHTAIEKARAHLKGGAKTVIISAPSDEPKPVIDVNHGGCNNSLKTISSTFCTTVYPYPHPLGQGHP